MIRLKSAGKTDVGLKREENEDNFIMLPDHGLYVLADGMGGHVGGKMASTLAVTLVTEFICVHAKRPDFEFSYKPDDSLSFEENVLVNAVKYANERIYIESCKNRTLEGMGTTITAVLATETDLCLAHVGDSRIYRLRQGELELLTSDHSLLNHLLSTGEIKPEDVHKFTSTNVILRAVGLKDYVEVSAARVTREPGDVFMMCSDGLTDLVDDFVIREVLRTAPSLPDACDQLIKLALHAGGKDNVTVVCVEVEQSDGAAEGRWTTGHFQAIPAGTEPAIAPPAAAPPAAQGGFFKPPQQAAAGMRAQSPAHGQPRAQPGTERLHAVRRPINGQPVASTQPAPAPPQAAAPAVPQQRVYAPPPPGPRRTGRSGTPPAPMEPVSSGDMQAQNFGAMPPPGHFAPPQQQQHAQPQQHVQPQRPQAAPPAGKYQPPPGAMGQPPTPVPARRSSTPTDMPAFVPPGENPESGPPAPGFLNSRSAPDTLPAGQFTPPADMSAEVAGYLGSDTPSDDAPAADISHDTMLDAPGVSHSGQSERISRDAIVAAPAIQSQAPVLQSGASVTEGGETIQEMPAFRTNLPQAQTGAAELSGTESNYKEDGSIMVDASLYEEPEASIVIDDSFLIEVDEEDEITHKGPPPSPPRAKSSANRETEILPTTNRRKP